jgi:hypothetical protein
VALSVYSVFSNELEHLTPFTESLHPLVSRSVRSQHRLPNGLTQNFLVLSLRQAGHSVNWAEAETSRSAIENQ